MATRTGKRSILAVLRKMIVNSVLYNHMKIFPSTSAY